MGERTFLGVYSSANKEFSGARRRLFFVWDNGQGSYDVQRVSTDFKPVDLIQTLPPCRFKEQYVLEPDIDVRPDGAAAPGRVTVQPSASAKEVENTLREHFRKALLRCRRPQDRDAAIKALQTLAEVEEGIEPLHKHMFADFGISLRKERQYALALAFCKRVLTMSPQDDHAHFNAARILLEMGNLDGAEQHILTARDMNPTNRIYDRMLRHLKRERFKKR